MNTDQIMLSPAKRAKRCILNLLAGLVVAVGAYAGYHSDLLPFEKASVIEATSDATTGNGTSLASDRGSQPSTSVQLSSMAGSIASAYLIKQQSKPQR